MKSVESLDFYFLHFHDTGIKLKVSSRFWSILYRTSATGSQNLGSTQLKRVGWVMVPHRTKQFKTRIGLLLRQSPGSHLLLRGATRQYKRNQLMRHTILRTRTASTPSLLPPPPPAV